MPLVSRMLNTDGVIDRATKPDFVVKALPSQTVRDAGDKVLASATDDSDKGSPDCNRQKQTDAKRSRNPYSPPMELEGELEIHPPSPESFSESEVEPDNNQDTDSSRSSTDNTMESPKESALVIDEDVATSPSKSEVPNAEQDSPPCEDNFSSDTPSINSSQRHGEDIGEDNVLDSNSTTMKDNISSLKRLREPKVTVDNNRETDIED